MNILAAVFTVSAVSWIVTREKLFEDLQKWARLQHDAAPSKWQKKLYYLPMCAFCIAPWLAALVCLTYGIELRWFFPVVWLAYLNLGLLAKVRA